MDGERKDLNPGPHDGVFAEISFNDWEVDFILESVWKNFREKFGTEEKVEVKTLEMEMCKVPIRKLQNLANKLAVRRRALAYKAKVFSDKGKKESA